VRVLASPRQLEVAEARVARAQEQAVQSIANVARSRVKLTLARRLLGDA
jgi:hypothetical protein